MRLIDADKFEVISFQGRSKEFCNGVMWMLEQIDKAPTAYDLNKVVEELDKLDTVGVEYCPGGYDDYICKYDVIEIVKRGGKE